MDVSIIIPVYKRTEWISKCLEQVYLQDFAGSYEVIVVNDGSPNSEEFKKIVEAFPSTRYIENIHAGPAAARNFGTKYSHGKLLCFLDDDSMPQIDWLSEITKSFNESVSVGLVNGLTCSYERKEGIPLSLEKYVYPKKSWATCNIAYRRNVYESLGGFDESFKEPSWEDNDLGLRAKWAGYTHIFNERAVVYHPHENSLAEYKKKCLLNGRGAAFFSRKYLFKRPLWGFGTPLIMSRHLIYGIFPSVWMRKGNSKGYLKFLWSFYSLQGFLAAIAGRKGGKD